jgi:hypothetical protein
VKEDLWRLVHSLQQRFGIIADEPKFMPAIPISFSDYSADEIAVGGDDEEMVTDEMNEQESEGGMFEETDLEGGEVCTPGDEHDDEDKEADLGGKEVCTLGEELDDDSDVHTKYASLFETAQCIKVVMNY